MIIRYVLLAVLAVVAMPVYAQSVPQAMNYQGRLTDGNGQPITGTRKLEFNVYTTAATGGSVLWGPQVLDNVEFSSSGEFNIILGPKDAAERYLSTAFAVANVFLGIKVGPAGGTVGAEIAPRQQILSVPFAFNGTPTGTISSFLGSSAPAGWVLCDGSKVDKQTRPELSALIDQLRALQATGGGDFRDPADPANTNKAILPDLRGMFLRGAGRNGSAERQYAGDTSHTPGRLQEDGLVAHSHPGKSNARTSASDGNASDVIRMGAPTNGGYLKDLIGTENQPGGLDETRPQNMAIHYIIKY